MRKVLAAILVAGLLLGMGAMAVDAQSYWQKFENIWARTLLTTGNATIGGDLTVVGATNIPSVASSSLSTTGNALVGGNATISGTSNLVGNVTVAGTLAANGTTFTVAKTQWFARQTAIAVTEGSVITPTGTFQELTAAGAVGASLAAPSAAGQTLILFNSTANTITLTDGSGQAFAGNIALGLNDSAVLISTQAGWWIELSRSDN